VAVVGGIVSLFWNYLRDKESQRQASLSALRGLAGEMDAQYRASKQIRRMLRSRREGEALRDFDADFFVTCMTFLSEVQLKIEVARNSVRIMTDRVNKARMNRIVDYLGYSADYLRKVCRDFEQNPKARDEHIYRLPPTAAFIDDFLRKRWQPTSDTTTEFRDSWRAFVSGELKAARKSTISTATESGAEMVPESDDQSADPNELAPSVTPRSTPIILPYDERFNEFMNLLKASSVVRKGTRSVADECILQAMRELREEIMTSKPLSVRRAQRACQWIKVRLRGKQPSEFATAKEAFLKARGNAPPQILAFSVTGTERVLVERSALIDAQPGEPVK
jgi:hypothetical protein